MFQPCLNLIPCSAYSKPFLSSSSPAVCRPIVGEIRFSSDPFALPLFCRSASISEFVCVLLCISSKDMPPKRIEDHPRIDELSGSNSIDEGADEDLVDEGSSDDEGVKTRAIHTVKLRKLVEENGPLPLTFHKYDGRPTGKYAAMFSTEIGVVVRRFAPLDVDDWKNIPEERKIPMFDRVQSFFNVDFSKGPDSVKRETEILMSTRYRNNRAKMHSHYKTLINLPWAKRLQNMPRKYCREKKDWEFLCNLFESEKFKARSKKNVENRSKLPFNHCGGSKSFVQYSYEIGGGPGKANRVALFKKTRCSEAKGWVEGAELVYNEMVELQEQYRQTQVDDGQLIDEVEISGRACDTILGKRSGYIKGLGSGPKPTKLTCEVSSRRASSVELKQELSSTRDELERTQASLKISNEKIERLEATQSLMMQLFQKIAPDALQSLIGQSSSTASSL